MPRSVGGLVCIFLSAVSLSWDHSGCLAEGIPVDSKCTAEKGVTSCMCGEQRMASESPSAATLSPELNTIRVACGNSFKFVPSNVTKVCVGPADQKTLQACEGSKREAKAGASSPILEFITSTPTPSPAVQWTKPDNQPSSLSFPPSNFPFTDKDFFVGCQSGSQFCVVPVKVSARKSVLSDNVLVCAYGADSNEDVPAVTLNSSSNSVTVVCGSDGEMTPSRESGSAYYCKDSAADGECTELASLSEILPGFSKDWWTASADYEGGARLVIPKTGFPAESKTIVLGCMAKKPSASDIEKKAEDASSIQVRPVCKVKVTLSAQTSGSPSTRFSVAMAASVGAFFGLVALS
ncbi:SAG-related sequence [Besnoitia besnoiti]|uniref:SAG-related sequence n=1 Tax=Besnoitia besnoiti TaxID=94643 RepID=A0A2A9MIN9_BESBE|nr:SAG-related sequence [Besnoitia besnoiti]PFH35270.1 SAG-related sequence [Besnoitia besnoiti]